MDQTGRRPKRAVDWEVRASLVGVGKIISGRNTSLLL